MQLTAETDDGNTYTATQENPLALNQWHQIAGSFSNNILTLAVGDQRIETAVTGQLSYTTASLNVGQGYAGLMNSLKWFNLASDPLTTFADGSETQSVMLGGTGQATITINSTGKMLSFNSQLPMQSIAVQADDTRQTIELLSTATFEKLAGASLSAGLVAGAPEFNLATLKPTSTSSIAQNTPASLLQSEALFPKAHAYNVSFMDVVGIAASLIGLDSLQVIWNQVGNMLSGKEVDIVAFSVALLDVLSLFPPAAPLKAVSIPAKTAIKLLKAGNNKAVQYLGGVMKKMFQQAKGRDFSLVYQGIAFFIIMADMALDEEAREGITEIAKMINSTDDFLDLMEYFSLADDEIGLPDTSTANIGNISAFEQFAAAEYGVFPQAHARVRPGIGVLIGKAMKELAPEIARMGKAAPKTLGELGRVIKKLNKQYLKDIAFKEGFLRGSFTYARKVGVSNIRKLLTSEHRVGPVTLIAIIAYLENELDEGRLFAGLDSYDKNHNESELRKLYVKSIPAVAAGDRDYSNFIRNAHGAQFQLLQIGILHALAEAGDPKSKVVGIEVPRVISIFADKDDLVDAKRDFEYDKDKVTDYGREIDIITGSMGDDEIWREMKSYKAKSKTNRVLSTGIAAWTWNKGKKSEDANDQSTKGNTPHRQYILDRIGNETFARMKKTEQVAKGEDAGEFNVNVENIYWHFHDFETKTTRSPELTNIKNAFNKEAVNKPDFYTDHVSTHSANTFVMGTIDLFLTNSRSNLADAVRAEVADKIAEVAEEVAP